MFDALIKGSEYGTLNLFGYCFNQLINCKLVSYSTYSSRNEAVRIRPHSKQVKLGYV